MNLFTPSMCDMRTKQCHRPAGRGFTLIEVSVTLSVIAVTLVMVQMSVLGLLRQYTFKGQIHEFVSTLQMAIHAAGESGRRYEVIIDPIEQSYLLREITTPDLAEVLQEEIILEGLFGEHCRVEYVEFDDGAMAVSERSKFRAGHGGWQYGGRIVFRDQEDRPYTVVVNRLNRVIELLEGEVDIWKPMSEQEISFSL